MMKKLVPFKKDINFDTNVALINSISLEHEVTKQGDHLIAGKFIINGDYKMTDTSVNLDDFEYELPFNINIDKKYDIDNASIDISDFYYEVVNNRILNVNIELCIDDIEEVEEEVMEKEDLLDELKGEEIPVLENQELQSLPREDREVEESVPSERTTVNVKSLFDGLDENEDYTVYKIHIVTENDTIESIINDYEVTKELLLAYNDLSEVKIGDKIIIPANEG
ncbi:MAG: LysM peptidoglycan-binding domain-containing protein [Bacilli bacterium]|nr:LysM peptidoglycan-binding domain-containing protein [Bacilli bacterium]